MIPDDVKSAWEAIGARGAAARGEWQDRFDKLSKAKQTQFNRTFAVQAPNRLASAVRTLKKEAAETKPKAATRKASEMA